MTLQEMGYMCLGKVEYEVLQTKGEAIISRSDVGTQEGLQMHMCLKNIGNRKKVGITTHRSAKRIHLSSSHKLRIV
jgi:hypothetical protein